jgi:hypothetical protein
MNARGDRNHAERKRRRPADAKRLKKGGCVTYAAQTRTLPNPSLAPHPPVDAAPRPDPTCGEAVTTRLMREGHAKQSDRSWANRFTPQPKPACKPSGKESLGEAALILPAIDAPTISPRVISPGASVSTRGPTDGDRFSGFQPIPQQPAQGQQHQPRQAGRHARGGAVRGETWICQRRSQFFKQSLCRRLTPTDTQRDNTQDE